MALLYNLIKKFRNMISHGIMSDYLDNPLAKQQPRSKTNTNTCSVQKDIYNIETRKRVASAFRKQWKNLQGRALKAHSATCNDPLTCSKKNCFNVEPAKIVKTSQIKREKTKGTLKNN